jgi:hypothetical protein
LQQIYDTALDKAILDCQNAINVGNADLIEIAAKKLIIFIREPEARKKLDGFIKETEHELRRRTCYEGYTVTDRYFHMVQTERYRMERGLELFDKTIGILDELGYLKRTTKQVQSNAPQNNQLFEVKS